MPLWKAVTRKAIRDRDELWCRCLCAALDPREVSAVLKVFNAHRLDQPVVQDEEADQREGNDDSRV